MRGKVAKKLRRLVAERKKYEEGRNVVTPSGERLHPGSERAHWRGLKKMLAKKDVPGVAAIPPSRIIKKGRKEDLRK